MRRATTILALVATLAAGPALAQPAPTVAAGLEDALRSLDAALGALEHAKGSRGKDQALQHLAVTRVRLVDALNALGGGTGMPAGAVGVVGGATVTVGPAGGGPA